LVLGEVRVSHKLVGCIFSKLREIAIKAGCACAQVATFITLASGMPFFLTESALEKPRFGEYFRLRFGFDILKWLVLLMLPLFFAVGLGLVLYEIYYELSTTSGKGKRFQTLLASLRVPGARRTVAEVKIIYETIVETNFLKPYPYSKLATICRACELLELKPQETMFSEGDVGDHFFVLIKGTVDVYIKEKTPPYTPKCVNTHHDRGSFGELALLQVLTSE
jgi:hypothetical protein